MIKMLLFLETVSINVTRCVYRECYSTTIFIQCRMHLFEKCDL